MTSAIPGARWLKTAADDTLARATSVVPRGRPRDRTHDVEILLATVRLLEHTAYPGLSIAAVARAAAVGKPTVYLRWPSKAALVADAVVAEMTVEPFADLGDVRSDLIEGLDRMIRLMNSAPMGRALPGLLADLHEDPELNKAFQQRYFTPRRASIRAALDRAVTRGEIPDGLDLDLVIDQLVGPVYFRLLTRGAPVLTAPDKLVDFVLAACRSSSVPH